MSNNKSIQVLRGNSEAIVNHANAGEELLDGQLLYNLDKNYLTVGGGANGNSLTKQPIVCREIIGYADDDSGITANDTIEYSIKYRPGEGLVFNNAVAAPEDYLDDGEVVVSKGTLIRTPTIAGVQSVAFGGNRYNRPISGIKSFIEGNQSFSAGANIQITGDFNAGFGKDNTIYQDAGFAAGGGNVVGHLNSDGTVTGGIYTFGSALGSSNKVDGRDNTAAGTGNQLHPNTGASFACGRYNIIGQGNSVTGGFTAGGVNVVQGNYSAAIGLRVYTPAGVEAFIGLGKNNLASSDNIFELGYGTSSTDKANALSVSKTADLSIAGSIESGSNINALGVIHSNRHITIPLSDPEDRIRDNDGFQVGAYFLGSQLLLQNKTPVENSYTQLDITPEGFTGYNTTTFKQYTQDFSMQLYNTGNSRWVEAVRIEGPGNTVDRGIWMGIGCYGNDETADTVEIHHKGSYALEGSMTVSNSPTISSTSTDVVRGMELNSHQNTLGGYGYGSYGHVGMVTGDLSNISNATQGLVASDWHNHDARYVNVDGDTMTGTLYLGSVENVSSAPVVASVRGNIIFYGNNPIGIGKCYIGMQVAGDFFNDYSAITGVTINNNPALKFRISSNGNGDLGFLDFIAGDYS